MKRFVGLLLGLCCSLPLQALPKEIVAAIGAVQGRAERSERVGETVTIEGVVTGAFADGLGGWFVQDAGDGDAATSDALFVSAEGGVPVRSGQRVRVTGTVAELDAQRGTLTALLPRDVRVLDAAGSVAATRITAPPQDWERYEGMRLRIDTPLIVSGIDDLARYGEIAASFGSRLFVPTEIAAPGAAAKRVAAENARRSLRIDDARDSEHPSSIWYLAGDPLPRTGSTIARAEGILDQRHGAYRLQLTAPPTLRAAPRPSAPKVAGDVRIASFNLENLFNGDGRGGGFPTPRGARTQSELQAQLRKLVATIHALDPDIAALMELENDGYGPQSSLATLVAALNQGGGDWRFVDTARGPGPDEIRVGLIYRASKVATVGAPVTLEAGPFGHRSRVPLAQNFRAGQGPVFTVVANHFKSKGCSEASGVELDQQDGQGCWNALRTDSARRLDQWLRTDPTRSGSDLVLIVGDFNAYAMEDPIRTFAAAGWRDAFAAAKIASPYSYVYDGQAGRLDHALLSPALAARLASAAEWHSNADEPENVGYRAIKSIEFAANPWRSSDHDPLLIGLRLRTP